METARIRESGEALVFGSETQLLGDHPLMQAARAAILRHARGDLPVLVIGETGTGKDLVARALHACSPRRAKPYAVLNCVALSESLLEDELFGHTRGAFTGALAAREGRFEHANGGTVLLDEVGDLPLATQVKLLRVIEYGEVFRVGSNLPVQVDVRVVAATHRDLPALIDQGTFRMDLYYRIQGVVIRIPALRDHLEDLPLYASHFLAIYARRRGQEPRTFSEGALKVLREHRWPGNVRELQNALWRAAESCDGAVLQAEDVLHAIGGGGRIAPPAPCPAAAEPADEPSRIRAALEREHWRIARAARALGIARCTLYRKMRQHGILP